MILLKITLFMLIVLPLCLIQCVIFIFGGWTMDRYERPNIIFSVMGWLDL